MEMTLPAWDLSSEYASLSSDGFKNDLASIERATGEIAALTASLRPLLAKAEWNAGERDALVSGLVKSAVLLEKTWVTFGNCSTFVHCNMSTDVTDEAAAKMDSKMQTMGVKLNEAYQPQRLFLVRAPEDVYNAFIKDPATAPAKFGWDQERLEKDLLLSEKEEALVSALRVPGQNAWGDLYNKLSGTMKIQLRKDDGTVFETVGLAQAQAYTKGGDKVKRKAAWKGIQEAWGQNKESGAAILNALAGWRLEMVQRRSHTRKIDFLEAPLRGARIERRTLDAMLATVADNVEPLRKANKRMAKLHGNDKMHPWDLLAPAPTKSDLTRDFEQGMKTITDAFTSVDAGFGEFASMMKKNSWIEARVLPNKTGGAYCTGFSKSRTPRVFQTYMGSSADVSTLAHELGHAFHSWVMRDLPEAQLDYPMTLAETASIFAETVLGDCMLEKSTSAEEKFAVSYAEAENAVSLLLNIPARFDFEKSFYEKRAHGAVSADELCQLTDAAWTKWYGDSLSENDKMFWATKLHFSIAGISFYNFPYTFGYLFSLSIYARRKELGTGFMKKYVEILRDTGRMTAEELVKKHLGEDLGSKAFWQKSMDVVAEKLATFERLSTGH